MKKSFAAAPGKGKLRVNRDQLFYILLLAFPLAQFCIFYIGVNFNSFLLAFQTYNTQTSAFQWDFGANFSQVWRELTTSSMLLDMLKNSLIAWFLPPCSARWGRCSSPTTSSKNSRVKTCSA